jgi:manganese/zinc/iron transport system permease protein
MILIAAVIGMLSGIIGALISFSAPRMPTGPWIVLAATSLFFVSLLFAPERGMVTRFIHYLQVRRQTHTENILKTFHKLREQTVGEPSVVTVANLHQARHLTPSTMKRSLARLVKDGLIEGRKDGYRLTTVGAARAARIVKLHRLWEVYLSDYINLPSDHVHRDAEQIEHVITPELEAELEALLNRPRTDPHGEPIPYPQEHAV